MPHNTSLLLVSIHHKVKHGITRDERAIEVINVGPIVDYSIKFDEVLKPLKVSVFSKSLIPIVHINVRLLNLGIDVLQ